MSQANVEAVLRGYEAFNCGDLDGAVEGFHPDVEWLGPGVLPDAQTHRGVEGVRALWASWRDSFEDFEIDIEEVIDVGDERVIVMAAAAGTGRDSGVEVRTPSFPHVWTIRDGKAIRVEMLPTRAAAIEAVGLSE